jgi:hypothetical protein
MPAASKKMVVGFNHNIKHNGKVYHVQTEDSGTDNPHVITHLFVGGNILSSQRSSYSHLMGHPNLEAQVRAMMELQHKEMLRSLASGAFEHMESHISGRAFQPGELAPSASPLASLPAGALGPPPRLEEKEEKGEKEEKIDSLFAQDLISEKSLDEVILSYLAGETEQK